MELHVQTNECYAKVVSTVLHSRNVHATSSNVAILHVEVLSVILPRAGYTLSTKAVNGSALTMVSHCSAKAWQAPDGAVFLQATTLGNGPKGVVKLRCPSKSIAQTCSVSPLISPCRITSSVLNTSIWCVAFMITFASQGVRRVDRNHVMSSNGSEGFHTSFSPPRAPLQTGRTCSSRENSQSASNPTRAAHQTLHQAARADAASVSFLIPPSDRQVSAVMLRPALLRCSQSLRALSTVASKDQVGVIGLGQMGGRMADNLRKHGHKLVVCDPAAANVQRQVDQGGAVAAGTPAEVAEQCDTIVTMLPSTASVESVYLGADGVHEALRGEHLLLDSSTIDPIFTKKLSAELHARGATFVDAPVSGGVAGAQNGTLTFMVGGEPEEFERVKPLLKAMGKNLVHCGGSCT
ncbi:unnamed protein product [Phytophthora fragariaefolia]|uniref:3-hydroxyisobutyrate dehydrogenase n=1 Tax=Phytophthora fragariaefolia TaxID=1490495 RepID=A0A9W6Y621_9STRA|nr:unnamed protein product [Phytophthora fragariaefolia]